MLHPLYKEASMCCCCILLDVTQEVKLMSASVTPAAMQKGAKSLLGPAFSDQNKSWLKRKQETGNDSDDLQDDLDDLQDHTIEGQHIMSHVCQCLRKHQCRYKGPWAVSYQYV